MSDVFDKLAALSPEQRAVLGRRVASRRPTGATIRRRTGAGPAPLSFAQRRLWFVQQLDPQSTAYNMMTALRLRGPLGVAAMQAAFAALADRHEALRTRYETGPDGQPRQCADAPVTLALVDVSASAEPEAAARAQLSEITARPHDLALVPARAGLVRLGADDHVLAIGLHHIAADRWSLGILIRELAVLYDAAARGAPSPLPAVPLQMPDFAAWQHDRAPELERQLDWWRAQLADAPVLDLPRDRTPGAADPAGGFHPFDLPVDLTRAARAAARRRGVSLFTLLLSNRDRAETQGLVGPLVNTLALRTDLSGAEGFAEILQRTGATLGDALAHGDVPLEHVVEALNPQRRPGEAIPLFRAKFDLQQADRLPGEVHGVRLERFPYEERAAKYELRFNLEDDGERVGGRIEYRADLYDAATIGQMAEHYRRLLRAVLDAPAAQVAGLAMLSDDERAGLIALGKGPPLPPHAETLHAAFEAQADRTPDAPAVWHAGATLNYAELDARANAVAAALIARDLPPEARVGIYMGRSPDLVAAILGTLKAGCAYVPLDPAYPRARIGFIAKDAGIDLVLTDGGPLPAQEEAIDATGVPDASRPAPRGADAGLAVIIYTSGSTGRPKGVALEHRNILARVAWAGETFGADDLAGMLFATSVSFDLSLFEIFATLALGGRLILADSLLDLPRLPDDAGVTFLTTVPSLLRELVRHHDLPPSVRAINLAGEFFPPALLDRLRAFPQLRTINNLYGPTEDAIYDAGNPVQDEPERPMPIGRPFPGTRLYILDRSGALLPRGVAGEICVAGAGLARGYLNRPDLTADRFRPDPFDGRPGARLYRTGDRGRWRADGRIDILGRIDTQVKIRGQRIEIGEIENALEAHIAVAEAAILATGNPGEPDRQLVAHVAPLPGGTAETGALRDHLAALLPHHMVPGLWRLHPALPRMPNGKVDRCALAEIAPDAPDRTPPATGTERRVIALWADLLGQDEIGAEDDFFVRGGHSLLAMQLLVRLQEEFGVELSLGRLFHALTPRLQAALVDNAAAAGPTGPDDPTAGLSDAEVDALLAQMSTEQTS